VGVGCGVLGISVGVGGWDGAAVGKGVDVGVSGFTKPMPQALSTRLRMMTIE
jgi:hypothetical protein